MTWRLVHEGAHQSAVEHTGADPDRSWHTTLTERAKGRAQ